MMPWLAFLCDVRAFMHGVGICSGYNLGGMRQGGGSVFKPKDSKVEWRVRRWCVKHRSLITVVGGLIILATFLVKDVLRDQEKDLADAINSAESIYLMRSADLELRKELNEVDMNVSISRREILQSLPPGTKVKAVPYLATGFDGHEDRLVRILSDTDVEVDNLQRLVAIVPPTPEHLNEFGKLFWEWDKLRLEDFAKPLPLLDSKPSEDSKVVEEHNQKYYSEVWLINSQMSMVGAEILDDAHHTKEKRERHLRFFSPISYILFGIGVVVTVVSKLFGIEGEGVEE